MHRTPSPSIRLPAHSALRALFLASLTLVGAACFGLPGADPGDDASSPTPPGPTAPPLLIGPLVQAEQPPPPIVGGTLEVSSDGVTAVLSDIDRDAIFVVDTEAGTLHHTLQLEPGTWPARIAIDARDPDRAWVVLRGTGEVLALSISQGLDRWRTWVCPAPRGLDLDEERGLVRVACAGGALVDLDGDTGSVLARHQLEPDLRDVVTDGDHLYVSRFRSAEVLVLDAETAELIERMTPPTHTSTSGSAYAPMVAWRMRPAADGLGGVTVLHQRARVDVLGAGRTPGTGGYYGSPGDNCGAEALHTALSTLRPGQSALATVETTGPLSDAPLTVDFVAEPFFHQRVTLASTGVALMEGAGSGLLEETLSPGSTRCTQLQTDDRLGFGHKEVISVARDGRGRLLVQSREPALLSIVSDPTSTEAFHVRLSEASRADTGHRIFHMSTSGGVACASCHPEGGEDGFTWAFPEVGPRRTPSLQGGLLATAPFHWEGNLSTMHDLLGDTFVSRMGGDAPSPEQAAAVGAWLDAQPIPGAELAARTDLEAVARGRALFEDATVGCTECHGGSALTNNQTVDVGTGRALQVPSLRGVGLRGPWMHDGCAPTLHERFLEPSCGGGDLHGRTSHLSSAEVDDLVTYLQSL